MKIAIAVLIFCAAFAVTLLLRRSEAEEPSRPPHSVIHITPKEAHELLSSATPYTILDVRTADEFQNGRIAGAINIDVKHPDFAAQLASLDLSKPVIVHCRSGARSRRALPELQKLALPGLYHMDGGLIAWQKVGLPIAH